MRKDIYQNNSRNYVSFLKSKYLMDSIKLTKNKLPMKLLEYDILNQLIDRINNKTINIKICGFWFSKEIYDNNRNLYIITLTFKGKSIDWQASGEKDFLNCFSDIVYFKNDFLKFEDIRYFWNVSIIEGKTELHNTRDRDFKQFLGNDYKIIKTNLDKFAAFVNRNIIRK